jgi:hypothetical protein
MVNGIRERQRTTERKCSFDVNLTLLMFNIPTNEQTNKQNKTDKLTG